MAERIQQRVSRDSVPVKKGSDSGVTVTLSVGVATVPPGIARDGDSILSEADANLYKAKQTGRNRVVGSQLEALDQATPSDDQ